MKRFAAAALGALFFVGGSAPTLAQNYNWAGLYFGVHGGYGRSDFKNDGEDFELNGGLVGAHVGYNWQWNAIVAGVEADGTLTWMGDSYSEDSSRLEVDTDWLASIRGRVGIDTGPALLYATAGVAWMDWSVDGSIDFGGLQLPYSGGSTATGYVVGGGAEFKLSKSLIARIEGLYYGFDDVDHNLSIAGIPIGTDAIDKYDIDITVVRGGLSWRY